MTTIKIKIVNTEDDPPYRYRPTGYAEWDQYWDHEVCVEEK